jgi:hypothetical protein
VYTQNDWISEDAVRLLKLFLCREAAGQARMVAAIRTLHELQLVGG